MELIRPFSKLGKDDATLAGGKGASLGEMTQAGIPVPPGFVILADSFEQFIKETDLDVEIDSILHTVKHEEIHTVENASEKIQALILRAEMPKDIATEIKKYFKQLDTKYVAVRSSATAEDSSAAAWAGQLDSYLNTTESNLLEKVKHCWASLFTPRAIFYRFEKELHETKISVAVVVQKMVESEVSGIAFSVHPVTQDYNQVIIEAGFGLGEAIVSGQITPDSYVIEKKPRRIIDKNVAEQEKGLYKVEKGGNEWRPVKNGAEQKLSDKQVLDLTDIILTIENHYKFPCDIEWAYEKGKFYIVQSRPITTLTQEQEKTESVKKNEQNQDKKTVSQFPYVNGKEWILAVTRNVSAWSQFLNGEGYYHNTIDFDVEAKVDSMSLMVEGTRCSIFFEKESMVTFGKAVLRAVDSKDKIDLLKDKYLKYGKEFLKSLEDCNHNLNVRTWESFLAQYRRYAAALAVTNTLGRAGSDILVRKLKEYGIPEQEISHLAATITYPTEHTPLFNSRLDLLKIGEKIQSKKINDKQTEKEIKNWLNLYGIIPVNFTDDPWTIEDAKKQLKEVLQKNCKEEVKSLEKSHNDKVKEASAALNKIKDKEIRILAYALAEGTYLNEFRKNIFCRVSFGFRPIFAKVAKKLGSNNWRDCFYLTPEEMTEVIKGEKVNLKNKIKDREIWATYVDTTTGKSLILDSEQTQYLFDYVQSNREKVSAEVANVDIRGFSANKGKVRGTVKIILSSKDFSKLLPGDILVTTMTSVDFVPIMDKAGAFVTNEGGITSHASIVAREMNKPCIIGTQKATKVLQDGDFVEVDADKGIVTIIKKNDEQINNGQIFTKAYTRDVSLIMQETWFYGQARGLKEKYGINNPHYPVNIYYMNDGAIEVWENEKALSWLKDEINRRNLKGPEFLEDSIIWYNSLIDKLKPLWKRGYTDDIKELKKFIKIAFEADVGFIPFYYSAIDERTPKKLREKALKIREVDTFFESTDRVIRSSLVKIYPKLRGYEATLLFEEIENPPSISVLAERKKNQLLIPEDVFETVTLQEFLKNKKYKFESDTFDQSTEIKGQTGFAGFAKGKVRKLRRKEQVSEIKEGEILVAPMTTPDFVPAMQKAAAIVTDEGGITCHAAIVARELKKPCIIGTKVATQALDDGDLVEVDAKKGIVRILNKSRPKENFSPEDWHFYGFWRCSVFGDWYWAQWLVPEYAEKIGLPLKESGIFVIKGGNFFTKKEVIATIREYAKNIIESGDRKKLASLKKLADDIYRDSLAKTKSLISKEITGNNIGELADVGRRIMFPWCFGYLLSEAFDSFLLPKAIAAGIKEEDIVDLIPSFETPLFEAQQNLHHIKSIIEKKGYWNILLEDSSKAIQKMKKDKEIMSLIEKHSEKYGWTNIMNLVGENLNIEQIIDQITHLPQQKKKAKNNQKNEDLSFLIECASITGYLRQTGVEYFSIYSRDAMAILKKTAKKIGVTYPQLLDLTLDEIISGIQGSDVKNIIEKRAGDNWAIYSQPNQPNAQPGVIDDKSKIDSLVSSMVPKVENSNVQVIKGQIGNKGLANGTVKVIMAPEDFSKIKQGDILVTTMTTPDFVPLMQKSAGIVTDIGGLLCHAAIISRELDIPCVIGTKFGTQLLHDGDQVEVDANKGMVRILKKNNENEEWHVIGKDFNSFLVRNQIFTKGINQSWKVIPELKEFNKALGIQSKNGKIDYAANLNLVKGMHELLKDKMNKDIALLKKIITDTNKHGDNSIKYAREITKSPANKKTNSQLIKEFNQLVERQEMLYSQGVILPLLDFGEYVYISSKIKEELERSMNKEKANDAFMLLTTPNEESFSIEEEIDLLNLALKIRKNALLKKIFEEKEGQGIINEIKNNTAFYNQLLDHKEAYAWVYYSFSGPAATLIDYVNSLKELIKTNPENRLAQLKEENELLAKKKKEIIDKYAKSNFAKTLFSLAGTFVWAKPRRKDYQSAIYYYLIEYYLVEMAKRLGIMREQILSLPFEDIFSALNKKIKIDISKADRIREHHIIIPSDSGLKLYFEDFSDFKGKIVEPKEEASSNIIKGNIAFKGKVTGKAVIVNTPQDMHKLKQGDILVSVATTPSIVPAMRLASAFVTDEGGLTCHAAIVAREMKKPCVVGTKIATKSIQDGDILELDANEGIVKILSTKSPVTLSKIFSREKTLLYFTMWNDSDRRGWKDFVGYDLKNSLFIVPTAGKKGSVWYSSSELDDINKHLEKKLKEDKGLLAIFKKRLDKNWKVLLPYLTDKKKITSVKEFESYYEHLVDWWSAMNTGFVVPNFPGVDEKTKKFFLEYRTESEKYTEKMNKVMVAFFDSHFPQFKDIMLFVSPHEVSQLESRSRDNTLDIIKQRKDGAVMFNEVVYPINKLDEILKKDNVQLEKAESEGVKEIKGNIAYKGLVKGKVRKILSFDDMKSFQKGEILVTEMTNPDYVPIMKIAAAVITDEGGTTCHAAIASRELRVPCIVGTKVATDILENGSEVEVDANTGVIRIIK